jgi:hypothetical protein
MSPAANEIDALFDKPKKKIPIQARRYACTVVNLLPIQLNEPKPHMLPSHFVIPAAVSQNGKLFPTVTHIEEGIHYIPNPLIDEGKPGSSIKQVTTPNEMARSIVEDYVTANVALGEDAEPGLFWVEGRLTLEEVREFHADKLFDAERKQINWFRNLCAMADADWQKNHNMLAVSDLQRIAARHLGVRKDWVDMAVQESVNCRFCTMPMPPLAIICPNCKEIVNKEAYDKLKEAR